MMLILPIEACAFSALFLSFHPLFLCTFVMCIVSYRYADIWYIYT